MQNGRGWSQASLRLVMLDMYDAHMSAYTSEVFVCRTAEHQGGKKKKNSEETFKLHQQNKAQGKSCQKTTHTGWLTGYCWEVQNVKAQKHRNKLDNKMRNSRITKFHISRSCMFFHELILYLSMR